MLPCLQTTASPYDGEPVEVWARAPRRTASANAEQVLDCVALVETVDTTFGEDLLHPRVGAEGVRSIVNSSMICCRSVLLDPGGIRSSLSMSGQGLGPSSGLEALASELRSVEA